MEYNLQILWIAMLYMWNLYNIVLYYTSIKKKKSPLVQSNKEVIVPKG